MQEISIVWDYEQDILNVVHQICVKYNLKYSLMFGTLLGAVRHGGFIPWDDDIDILMPRDDYEKLLAIWDNAAPEGYLLQNKRTNSDFTQNFTKIRKNNTTFIQEDFEKTVSYHTGIFIDIFPADRVAPKGICRSMQYMSSAINLLTSRGHASGMKGVIGLIEKIVLALPLKIQLWLYHRSETFLGLWNDLSDAEWYSPNVFASCKRYFDSDLFENMRSITFRGKDYFCVGDYDKTLRKVYGDYMQLPPEEERVWSQHPLLLDFERIYKEIPIEER